MSVSFTQVGRLIRSLLVGAVLIVSSTHAEAQAQEPEPDPMVPVGFVVIRSTSDYGEARHVATRAAEQLSVPLNLRGLVYDGAHGLTWPREQCEKDSLSPFPCYLARGRFDPGVYLSIERSDAYASFRPGLFIVIVASGEPGSAELAEALQKARSAFPDAYVKQEKVYHGCMH